MINDKIVFQMIFNKLIFLWFISINNFFINNWKCKGKWYNKTLKIHLFLFQTLMCDGYVTVWYIRYCVIQKLLYVIEVIVCYKHYCFARRCDVISGTALHTAALVRQSNPHFRNISRNIYKRRRLYKFFLCKKSLCGLLKNLLKHCTGWWNIKYNQIFVLHWAKNKENQAAVADSDYSRRH